MTTIDSCDMFASQRYRIEMRTADLQRLKASKIKANLVKYFPQSCGVSEQR